MNDTIQKYIEENSLYINNIDNYKKGDKLYIQGNSLFELQNPHSFYSLFDDDGIVPNSVKEYLIIQTSKTNSGTYSDPQYLFYKKVNIEVSEIVLILQGIKEAQAQHSEQLTEVNSLNRKADKIKTIEENQKAQSEQITGANQILKSINAKLTFFVILTIVNIIASIILALK